MGVLDVLPEYRANIFDEIHSELDQRVFKGQEPRPLIVTFIQRKIFSCLRDGFIDNPEKYFTLYLTGSLTTYQYSDASDCDVSVFPAYGALTDLTGEEDPEQIRRMLILLVTTELDGTDLPGTPHPMQNFVQKVGATPGSMFKPGLRSAWDFQTRKWLVPPEHERSHDPVKEFPELFQKAQAVGEKMTILLDHGDIDAAKQLYKDIHEKRALDPSDYSEGNIEYKWLAHRGLFDRLRDEAGMRIGKTAKGSEDTEPIGKDVGFLGEPHDTLYPPLFKGMKLRPEVAKILKEHALEAIAEEFENPDKFCYFTIYGSGISYNWDEKGDVDIQIWVDIDEYTGEPKTQDDLVADVRRLIAPINFASVKELGINTQGLPGTTLIQYYAKPGTGAKEENLASKPYACYDLETNKWLVRPTPIKPDFYGDAFLKMLPEANDVANEAESLLDDFERHVLEWEFWQQLDEEEPHEEYKTRANLLKDKAEQEQEGITRIFQRIFKGRADAYSPGGEGINDQRDILQKYLEIWGLFQRLKMDARKALPWKDASWHLADAPLLENPVSYNFIPLTQQEITDAQPSADLFKSQAKTFNHRSEKLGLPGRVRSSELAALFNRYNGNCAYCGKPGADSFDHVIPTSRGGGGDISNLLPAHTKCNQELGMWDENLEHPLNAVPPKTIPDLWRSYPAMAATKKEDDSEKMKVIYDFNNDSIMLGSTTAKDKPERDGVIIGEYDGSNVKLFDVAKQWVNANYFKRLWINSFPTRPIEKVFFDKHEVPTRPTNQMTYLHKLPHLTSSDKERDGSHWKNFLKNRGIVVDFKISDGTTLEGKVIDWSDDTLKVEVKGGDERTFDDEFLKQIKFKILDKRTLGAKENWWQEDYGDEDSYDLPQGGTFGFINGHLILAGVHHKAIMSELLNAGWTWDQLMNAEQAWGWFSLRPWAEKEKTTVYVKFVSDSGYQNEKAKGDCVRAFELEYHMPVIVESYQSGVSNENEYGTGLGAQKAVPGEQDWVSPVPGPPADITAAYLEDVFKHGHYKLAVPLDQSGAYFKSEGLPYSGSFGYVADHLMLADDHHQAIMGTLIDAGWTWEQLMQAEQSWGWFSVENARYHYYDEEDDERRDRYYLSVNFVSDSGYLNDRAIAGARKQFEDLYHLPVEEDVSGGVSKGNKSDYGTGLSGRRPDEGYTTYLNMGTVPPPPAPPIPEGIHPDQKQLEI